MLCRLRTQWPFAQGTRGVRRSGEGEEASGDEGDRRARPALFPCARQAACRPGLGAAEREGSNGRHPPCLN